MKKILTIFCLMMVVVIAAFFLMYILVTTPKYGGEFSLDAYAEEIENPNFQTENPYGEIVDYKSAAEVGEKAIVERFPNAKGSLLKWRGYSVEYDKENDVYHVVSYPISLMPMFGGSYEVIIKSDDTILAIWGNK